ncbi:uncharacterized protein LOC113237090 [Hyposmocoma kahamanoa]|uniref:uncharacterized protein LOC113237090 n=1 Tax=Hyposmocoma kahamanoa TaxID=1477025 RepID=UPI000E6D671F|nr:uncharacterized protein LOC113237090 [Hyposmocoma kahamanoa]
MDERKAYGKIIDDFSKKLSSYYESGKIKYWYPMFSKRNNKGIDIDWVAVNDKLFLKNTPNKVLYNRWIMADSGFITALVYSADGQYLIIGHSTGLVQMRHGQIGTVMATLRNIQFPPKPVYALEYSRTDKNVCYAACTDGAVYKLDIPDVKHMNVNGQDTPKYCIRADPALECLNTQYYGNPSASGNSSPFITQRTPVLSLGLTADSQKMVVGSADCSVKVYDMETQEPEVIFKVHKLRLQFIPKKLQRVHSSQVVAVRCHDQKPNVFATGSWDKTLRIWDTRCKIGCMMTFEGVNVCHDSIDLNRDHCIAGSWSPTEGLSVFDIVARRKLHVVRVQNRRPDVDGEYVYACRYWRSQFNHKGKYAIIGGSGTNCVEVINLHNRYITCSYPASGTVLAVSSHEDRIAFGGTAPVFNIVSFHDPKHEKYEVDISPLDFTRVPIQEYEMDLTRRSSIIEDLKKNQEGKKKSTRTSNETMDTLLDNNEDKVELKKQD